MHPAAVVVVVVVVLGVAPEERRVSRHLLRRQPRFLHEGKKGLFLQMFHFIFTPRMNDAFLVHRGRFFFFSTQTHKKHAAPFVCADSHLHLNTRSH